jgi:chromosome segregation ATPase
VHRPDLSALNRHFGEIESQSRGLRSRVEDQSEQIGRIQEHVERLASAIESVRHDEQELASAFRSLAGLLKGLFFAILFLLVAITVLSVLILFRIAHT